ncbi:MAG: hypothetical protein MI723_09320 [Caulobacterales bacterium]|nr:hypothetical protein [Caulobacterales bacterium]
MARITVNALLALGCLLVAVQIAGLAARPAAPVPAGSDMAAAGPAGDERQVRYDAPSLEAFASIAERPLFSSARRASEPAGGADTLVDAPEGVRLTGVFIAGERRKASFAISRDRSDVVDLGDDVAGWRVIDIAPDAVVLERDGVRRAARLDAGAREALSNQNGSAHSAAREGQGDAAARRIAHQWDAADRVDQ